MKLWGIVKKHKILSGVLALALIVSTVGVSISPAIPTRLVSVGGSQKYEITIGEKVLAAGLSADYTCNGTNDNIIWTEAISALPAGGGIINDLTGGNYNFSGTVNVPANVTIMGIGRASSFSGTTPCFTSTGNGTTYENLSVSSGGITTGATTGWLEINVLIGTTLYTERSPNSSLTDTTFSGNVSATTVAATTLNAPTGRTASWTIAAYNSSAANQAQANQTLTQTQDLGAAINTAVALFPASGGTVSLCVGDYEVKTTIALLSYQNLIGEAWGWNQGGTASGGVRLILSADTTMLQIGNSSTGSVSNELKNLYLDGGARGYGVTSYGLYCIAPGTAGAAPVHYNALLDFENIRIDNFNSCGLAIADTQDSYFSNVIVSGCGNVASTVPAMVLSGTSNTNTSSNTLINCTLDGNYYKACIIDNYSNYNRFISPKFDQSGATITSGFYISGSHNLIDNLISATVSAGINTIHFVENGGSHCSLNTVTNSHLLSTDTTTAIGIYDSSTSYGQIITNNTFDGFNVAIDEFGTGSVLTGNKCLGQAWLSINCWGSNSALVLGNQVTQGIGAGTGEVARSNVGYNPIGKITNFLGGVAGDIGDMYGNSSTVVASTAYTIVTTDCYITSTDSSNSNCAISIKDAGGNTLVSGLHTLSAQFIPIGYVINWGAFTGSAPTVTVFGN